MQKLIILFTLLTASISNAQASFESCIDQSLVAEGVAIMRDKHIPLDAAIQYYNSHNNTTVEKMFKIILEVSGEVIYNSNWSSDKVRTVYFSVCEQ